MRVLAFLAVAHAAVLDGAETEAEARARVDLTNLKSLDKDDLETMIRSQWWTLARDVVIESHKQGVDFSSVVRSTVRDVKNKAEELLRSLDPNYGKPIPVSPAFQTAQNKTDFILHVKFTARWNAPGALEVKDGDVKFTESTVHFTGIGEHSNKKYQYSLKLDVFDEIVPDACRWDTASVGKIMIYLRKRVHRKWPRLLRKKKKISNMHHWMEMQEKLDASFDGRSSATQSPFTCADKGKLYCSRPTDRCVDDCKDCEKRPEKSGTRAQCEGPPQETPTVNFTDTDMTKGELGGAVSASVSDNSDVDGFNLYWADEESRSSPAGGTKFESLAVAPGSTGGAETMLPPGTQALQENIRACAFNQYGEGDACGWTSATDAFLPPYPPQGCSFEDQAADPGSVSGDVTISPAASQEGLTQYAVYWGRSRHTKIASSAYIGQKSKEGDETPKEVRYYISSNTKIPKAAKYLLVYSKNEHGERPEPCAVQLVDRARPSKGPAGLTVAGETAIIQPSTKVHDVSNYELWFGKPDSCQKDDKIMDVPKDADLGNIVLPAGRKGTGHVLAFASNAMGTSKSCATAEAPHLQEAEADAPKAEL